MHFLIIFKSMRFLETVKIVVLNLFFYGQTAKKMIFHSLL